MDTGTQRTRSLAVGEMCTDLENALQCSITMEVCKDPVVAPSGHVYERSKILQWIRMHGNDPQTRARLKATHHDQ